MFDKILGRNKNVVTVATQNKNSDGLSDTDRRLRDQFYTDPVEDDSEMGKMFNPKIYAPQLYKKLAAYGYETGWIKNPEEYPLIYPLLYNAMDVAQGVFWRFQQMVKNDDEKYHTGAFKMTLAWCVYVAMADVYFWQQDWDDLRNIGMIYKLENTCGFDNIDDFVEEKFNIINEDELRDHILKLRDIAKQPWDEVDSLNRMAQTKESMTAMFYYGIELGMQYLGLLEKSNKVRVASEK